MATQRPTPAQPPSALRLRFHPFELDEADARLTRAGQPVPLAPKPFAVLCALARTPRSLVTKNALLDTVWGHRFVTESVLKSTISELRAALEDDPKQPRYIETVSRRGYRFIANVNQPGSAVAFVATPVASRLFIGRAEPLERLRNAWRLASGGQRQIVWIAGEAGVGKTTLGDRFIAEVGDEHCIHGQCVEQYGAGEPYLPVLEALTGLCKRDPAAADLIRSVAPTWLLQLPWLSTPAERDVLRRDLAGVGQSHMLREMGEFLDRYTANRPLVLITADVHWSDKATVQLMDYMARRRSVTRLLWLASFRLTEVIASDHPFRSVRNELRMHGLADEIVLDEFSEQEVAQYVAEHLPARAGDDGFVRALHERTDGLPLFVADIVKDVLANDGRASSMAVPRSLAGVVERYIRQLSPGERGMLEAASVCGTEFRPATVAQILGADAAAVIDSCAELARQQRWLGETQDGYVFRHALYREVLYRRIAPLARVELHRKAAAALEHRRSAGEAVSAGELASHFELGRQPLAAVRYYAEAADAALAQFLPEECLRITQQAAPLLVQAPAGRERDALELSIDTLRGVSAMRVLGAGAEAKTALRRAYSLLDGSAGHPMRGRLLHGLGYLLYVRGEYAEAREVGDRAQALGSESDDPVLLSAACSVHGHVDHLQGRPAAAREWLERGLRFAERLDVAAGEYLVDPQVAMLSALSVDLAHLGLVDEALACVQRAHSRARERGWPMAQMVAIWYAVLLEMRLGNVARVAALADEMRGLLNEFHLAHGDNACRWFRAWADAHLGKPGDAYRVIREAYDDNARLGLLAGTSETLGYAAEALFLAGDLEGARKQLDEARQFAGKLGERMYLPQLHILDARIADASGDAKRAHQSIRDALAEARAHEAPWLEMLALSALCERPEATAKDRASLRATLARITGAEKTEPVLRALELLKR